MKSIRVSLFAALLLSLGIVTLSADDKKPEDEKKLVRVVLKMVQVADSKADGSAWDINNGKPDLVVRIKNMSDASMKEFASEEKTDMTQFEFNRETILAAAGQNLQVAVVDKDLAVEDMIGEQTISLTDDMIKKGKLEITQGQLKKLVLEFRNP